MIITDGVRSTGKGNIYNWECLSVPFSSRQGDTPFSQWEGDYSDSSLMGRHSNEVQRGVSHSANGDYPIQLLWSTPMGVSHPVLLGVPPLAGWIGWEQTVSTPYSLTDGGIPIPLMGRYPVHLPGYTHPTNGKIPPSSLKGGTPSSQNGYPLSRAEIRWVYPPLPGNS